MNNIAAILKRYRAYLRSIILRHRKAKKDKEEDPFIYPLF